MFAWLLTRLQVQRFEERGTVVVLNECDVAKCSPDTRGGGRLGEGGAQEREELESRWPREGFLGEAVELDGTKKQVRLVAKRTCVNLQRRRHCF